MSRTVEEGSARVVGVCSSCGGDVELERDLRRIAASCPCGKTRIPARFFDANRRLHGEIEFRDCVSCGQTLTYYAWEKVERPTCPPCISRIFNQPPELYVNEWSFVNENETART